MVMESNVGHEQVGRVSRAYAFDGEMLAEQEEWSRRPLCVVNHEYRAGSGTPLVLVHAFPIDHRMWDECAALIISRSARAGVVPFAVWAPDMPGAGMSPVPVVGSYGEPREDGAYPRALDAIVETYVDMLHDAGYDKAVWAGISMGGYVALDVQRLHPECVAGLALCDTTADADVDGGAKRLGVAQDVVRGLTVMPVLHFAQPAQGDSTVRRSSWFIDEMTSWIREQSPAGIDWRQRMAAGRPDMNAQLPRITVPSLVLCGDRDPSSGPDRMRVMASHMTGTEVDMQIIHDCGHFSAVEHPEEVAEALLHLMARVGR